MRVLAEVLHMNGGNGDSSYANNSLLQKIVIEKVTPVLKCAIKGMVDHDVFLNDQCFKVADLGCSSGMNTLSFASFIIDAVHEACEENNCTTPQFQVFINDLIKNDFNSVFKLLPDFYENLMKKKGEKFNPCFVSAVPGSFYVRLFPDKTLHFVHSSNSVHWLSQVPEGIETNKSNIYIGETSPPNVFQAYKKQFHTDFTRFLQLRYEEIVHGGCMVLALLGRGSLDPADDDSKGLWELLGESLLDMAKEGLVSETDVNSFNMPFYFTHENELRNIIDEANALFSLDNMNTFELKFELHATDSESIYNYGKNKVNGIRTVSEPLLTSHFGNSIIDLLFEKLEKKVVEHRGTENVCTIVVSLTRI